MNRAGRIGGRVLDRAADKADRGSAPNRLGGVLGPMSEAILKIGRYGQIGRGGDRAGVPQRFLATERHKCVYVSCVVGV